MSLELRPRVGIAAPFGSIRAGLRAMLGEDFDTLEAAEVDHGEDVDLWIIDADEWNPISTPYLHLSDQGNRSWLQVGEIPVAFGVLRRDIEASKLRAAVRAILSGLVVIEPEWAGAPSEELTATRSEELTMREQEVLQFLATGLANKQIAGKMGISIHTVKFHTAAILAKLGAASRTEAVTIGAKRGWIVF